MLILKAAVSFSRTWTLPPNRRRRAAPPKAALFFAASATRDHTNTNTYPWYPTPLHKVADWPTFPQFLRRRIRPDPFLRGLLSCLATFLSSSLPLARLIPHTSGGSRKGSGRSPRRQKHAALTTHKHATLTLQSHMICRRCNKRKKLFGTQQSVKRRGDKIYRYRWQICLDCLAERRNKYRQTEQYRARARQHSAKHRQLHPERVNARYLVQKALYNGDIIRPLTCFVSKCPTMRLEAHHNDYTKPLEVVWLCKRHHSHLHSQVTHSYHTTHNNNLEAAFT